MDADDLELLSVPVGVRVTPLERRSTTAPLAIAGRFAASRAALIKAPASGRVEGLRITLGDLVEEGEPLCTIGLEDARQRLLSAEASVHQHEAQLAEREDQLWAARQRDEPREKLAAFELKLRAAQHKLEHERLVKERLAATVGAHSVYAPFSARVASLSAAPGGSVMIGAPLLELVAVNPIVLVLEVPTWVASRLGVGDAVRVRAASHEDPCMGRVARWAPTAIDDLRRLLIDVDNDDGRIAAGERATAELAVGERAAFFAPREAVHEAKGVQSLKLVSHGKVRVLPVRVVGGDERDAELAGAVSASQLVILEADRPVKEDTEVRVRFDH